MKHNLKPFENSLGIAREDMPQIPNDKIELFLDSIGMQDLIQYSHIPLNQIRPIQTHYLQDKIDKKIAGFKSQKSCTSAKIKTLIVSSDFYLLDGHHNWKALYDYCPEGFTKVYILPIKVEEMLDLAKKFPYTTYQTWDGLKEGM